MKNFTKKFQYKSILALLVLLPVILLLSVTFTMSKYVTEKKVGNLTLNLTSIDVLLPGLEFRKAMGTSVTEVVFGKTDDYADEIIFQTGKFMLIRIAFRCSWNLRSLLPLIFPTSIPE